jgi:hypothetical protein
MAIPLSCQQWDAVHAALRPLPPDARDEFLLALAKALDGGQIGDGAHWRAIREVQRQFWTPPPTDRFTEKAHTRRRVGEPLL